VRVWEKPSCELKIDVKAGEERRGSKQHREGERAHEREKRGVFA